MHKKLLMISLLFLIMGGAVVSISAQGKQPPSGTRLPPGPITQEQAVTIGLLSAQAWGEQSAQVTSIRKELRSEFTSQLKAQGDDVVMAGTGDVWIVDLNGKFTPNRGPFNHTLQCDKMFVVVDTDTGEVISAGCR
jgi:hypothetical protein